MSLRKTSFLVTLVCLLIGSSAALAESPSNPNLFPDYTISQRRGNWNGQGGKREKLIEQLNLSNTQQQQIAAIRQKYQGQMSQAKQNMRAAQQQLRDLMAGNGSEAQIRSKHDEVVKLRQELEQLRFQSMLEMREVLTPEQRNQLAQLMQQRRR
jgi:Spy/CpxP family protein refolding chaperone